MVRFRLKFVEIGQFNENSLNFHVYNTAGGLPSEYFDVGVPDGSGLTYPRFYYDAREGRCIQFSVFSKFIHLMS